jgi:hypothetical protein
MFSDKVPHARYHATFFKTVLKALRSNRPRCQEGTFDLKKHKKTQKGTMGMFGKECVHQGVRHLIKRALAWREAQIQVLGARRQDL